MSTDMKRVVWLIAQALIIETVLQFGIGTWWSVVVVVACMAVTARFLHPMIRIELGWFKFGGYGQ